MTLTHLRTVTSAHKTTTGLCLALVALLLFSACDRQPSRPDMNLSVPGETTLATFKGGEQSIAQTARWALLFQSDAELAAAAMNETGYIHSAVRNSLMERSLAQKARNEGYHETEAMQEEKEHLTRQGISKLYYLENIVYPVEVTGREIKSYYNTHLAEYTEPLKFSFRMIFFDAKKHGREKARRKAQRVMDRIEKGALFESLIHDNSDVGVIKRNKEFGPYSPGEGLEPAIERAAAQLQQGEVSGIIEHDEGFHIIKITKRIDPYERPLEEVRDEIRKKLFEEKIAEREIELLKEHEDDLSVQKNYHIVGLPITATNDVVLRVEQETLTYGDYLEMARRLGAQNKEEFQKELEKAFRNLFFLALGRRENYKQKPEFQEWFNLYFDRALTFAYLRREVDDQISIPPEEISDYYDDHTGIFYVPKMIFARRIYLPFEVRPDMKRHELIRSIQETRGRMESILNKIRNGLSFEDAARNYSYDVNSARGGLMGWVKLGQSARFDNAADPLEEGQITNKPVNMKRGMMLLKVEKIAEPRKQSLDEVYSDIEQRLLSLKINNARNEFLADYVEQLQIEVKPEAEELYEQYIKEFSNQLTMYSFEK